MLDCRTLVCVHSGCVRDVLAFVSGHLDKSSNVQRVVAGPRCSSCFMRRDRSRQTRCRGPAKLRFVLNSFKCSFIVENKAHAAATTKMQRALRSETQQHETVAQCRCIP